MESNFWRYYRLVFSQRWWILALMTVAAAVILVGSFLQSQTVEYEAVAIIEPQTEEMNNLLRQPDRPTSEQDRREQNIDQVSDLIMLLRSSNDLYLRTARLLKLNEEERAKEVGRILEKNGFFAPYFADVDSQAAQRLAAREMLPAEAEAWKRQSRQEVRALVVNSFARAADPLGGFAVGGVSLSEDAIVERIRRKMSFNTVEGPLTKEDTQQVVNQIRISATFDRIAEAELYVNALCVAFLDFYASKSMGVLNSRLAQLEEKRDQARKRLEDARKDLVAFEKSRGVTLTTAQEQSLTNYLTVQRERDQARQLFSQAQASVTSLEGAVASVEANPTIKTEIDSRENPLVVALEQRYFEAKAAFDRIKNSNYGTESPEYKAAEKSLNDAETDLKGVKQRRFGSTVVNTNRIELERQLAIARAQRDGYQKQLDELERQVTRQEALVAQLPAAQAKIADLRQEVTTAEKFYNSLQDELYRLQTLAIGQSRAGAISIVSQAHVSPPENDALGQRLKLLVYGMALALIFGIALVVGLDTLDNSIQTTADVEELLGLPVVGVIPAQLPDPARASRVAHLDPLSPVAESYRMMRTDLLFTIEEKRRNGEDIRSLMVATGKPGQGATTTISNLAIALAQSGKRVILVDADLRYPKLHTIFEAGNRVGLTSLLEGQTDLADFEEALQPTDISNLRLLAAGPVSLYPSELLASSQMRAVHEQLKAAADYVLFDTPSAVVFSDAAILASQLDAVLMVVRANNIPRGAEDYVRRLLNKARANILGVALNGVPADKVDSVHYHRHYYPALLRSPDSQSPPGLPPVSDRFSGAALPAGREIPLALPGVPSEPTSPHSSAGEAVTAGSMPAYLDHFARPADAPSVPLFQRIPWRVLGLTLLGGGLIGLLVLLLASGQTVK